MALRPTTRRLEKLAQIVDMEALSVYPISIVWPELSERKRERQRETERGERERERERERHRERMKLWFIVAKLREKT